MARARRAGSPDGAAPRSTPASALGRAADGRTDGRRRRSAAVAPAARATKPPRWRDAGLVSFVPCVSNDLTIAVLAVGPPRARRAAQQRGHDACSPRSPARRRPRSRTRGSTASCSDKANEIEAAAPVQRQRRRVADRRRWSSSISTIACCGGTGALESLVGVDARPGARPAARRRCSAGRSSTRSSRPRARVARGHHALSRAARRRHGDRQARRCS